MSIVDNLFNINKQARAKNGVVKVYSDCNFSSNKSLIGSFKTGDYKKSNLKDMNVFNETNQRSKEFGFRIGPNMKIDIFGGDFFMGNHSILQNYNEDIEKKMCFKHPNNIRSLKIKDKSVKIVDSSKKTNVSRTPNGFEFITSYTTNWSDGNITKSSKSVSHKESSLSPDVINKYTVNKKFADSQIEGLNKLRKINGLVEVNLMELKTKSLIETMPFMNADDSLEKLINTSKSLPLPDLIDPTKKMQITNNAEINAICIIDSLLELDEGIIDKEEFIQLIKSCRVKTVTSSTKPIRQKLKQVEIQQSMQESMPELVSTDMLPLEISQSSQIPLPISKPSPPLPISKPSPPLPISKPSPPLPISKPSPPLPTLTSLHMENNIIMNQEEDIQLSAKNIPNVPMDTATLSSVSTSTVTNLDPSLYTDDKGNVALFANQTSTTEVEAFGISYVNNCFCKFLNNNIFLLIVLIVLIYTCTLFY
jgi:hypothetical protein